MDPMHHNKNAVTNPSVKRALEDLLTLFNQSPNRITAFSIPVSSPRIAPVTNAKMRTSKLFVFQAMETPRYSVNKPIAWNASFVIRSGSREWRSIPSRDPRRTAAVFTIVPVKINSCDLQSLCSSLIQHLLAEMSKG